MIDLEKLTIGERERLRAGRTDWRQREWQDHCGIEGCEQCDGAFIPAGRPHLLSIASKHARMRLLGEAGPDLIRLELALRLAKELNYTPEPALHAITGLETAGLITITA